MENNYYSVLQQNNSPFEVDAEDPFLSLNNNHLPLLPYFDDAHDHEYFSTNSGFYSSSTSSSSTSSQWTSLAIQESSVLETVQPLMQQSATTTTATAAATFPYNYYDNYHPFYYIPPTEDVIQHAAAPVDDLYNGYGSGFGSLEEMGGGLWFQDEGDQQHVTMNNQMVLYSSANGVSSYETSFGSGISSSERNVMVSSTTTDELFHGQAAVMEASLENTKQIVHGDINIVDDHHGQSSSISDGAGAKMKKEKKSNKRRRSETSSTSNSVNNSSTNGTNSIISITNDLSKETISSYFYMPITQAAKHLNIGLTLLKKRCRELGIPRWPHRKLMSLQTLIKNVQEMGKAGNPKVKDAVESLEQQRKLIEEMPGTELEEQTKKLRQACFKDNYKKRKLMGMGMTMMDYNTSSSRTCYSISSSSSTSNPCFLHPFMH